MFDFGLSYVRSDFHLHTHKDKEFIYTGEQNSFVKDYVSALKQAGIRVGIITNHNKFDKDEYIAIRKAARKEDIFIFANISDFQKPGLYWIDLHCAIDQNGITSYRITPSKISVKLERVSKR